MLERGYGFAPAPEFQKEIKEMTPEQIISFVNANKIPISAENKLSRCVDGRYDNLENFPVVAKPGGDAGDMMVAFAAINLLDIKLSHAGITNAIAEVVGGKNKLNFHTDEHAEHEKAGHGMGCGHLKNARLNPDLYGMNQNQIDYIFNELPKLLKEGSHEEVLHGEHEEQAVIVVVSDKYGLKPLLKTDDGVQEAFIYHQTLHEEQLDKLARVLQMAVADTGKAIEEQEIRVALKEAFGKQLVATLNKLANGKPVYNVRITDEEIEVM